MTHDGFPQRINNDLIGTGVSFRELHDARDGIAGFVLQAVIGGMENDPSVLTLARQPGDRHSIVASIQPTIFEEHIDGVRGPGRTDSSGYYLDLQPEILPIGDAVDKLPFDHPARQLVELSSFAISDRIEKP